MVNVYILQVFERRNGVDRLQYAEQWFGFCVDWWNSCECLSLYWSQCNLQSPIYYICDWNGGGKKAGSITCNLWPFSKLQRTQGLVTLMLKTTQSHTYWQVEYIIRTLEISWLLHDYSPNKKTCRYLLIWVVIISCVWFILQLLVKKYNCPLYHSNYRVCECVFAFVFSLILRTGGTENPTTTTTWSTVQKRPSVTDASGTTWLAKPLKTGSARYQ